jgi:hypothetical protein
MWVWCCRHVSLFVAFFYVTRRLFLHAMPAVNTECSEGKAINANVCILVKYKIFHWVGGHYFLPLTLHNQSCFRHTLVRRPSAVRWILMRGHSNTWGRSDCSVPYKNFRKKKSRALLLFLLEMYSSTLWLLQHKEKQSITIIYAHCVGFCFFQNILYQQVRTVTWASHSIPFSFFNTCVWLCVLY